MMTHHAILRFEKVKTIAKLKEAQAHVTRSRETPNADPAGKVFWAVAPKSDLVEDVAGRLPEKRRRDAVICMQAIVSASPDYFGEPWDAAKVDAWLKATVAWTKTEFGRNLVGVSVHLDETTPHLHVFVVPIEDDGRLCAKTMFNPSALRRLQTAYGKAVKPLGIQRGVEGSKAKHTELKDFYRNIGKNIEPPTASEIAAWKVTGTMPETIAVLIDKATAGDLAREELKGIKATLANVDSERMRLQEEAAKYRYTSLPNIILALGGIEKSAGNFVVPELPGRPAIKVYENGKGFSLFKDTAKTPEKGKNAIDLLKSACGLDFTQAIRWLGSKFGVDTTANTVAAAMAEDFRVKMQNLTADDLKPVEEIKARARSSQSSASFRAAPQMGAAKSGWER